MRAYLLVPLAMTLAYSTGCVVKTGEAAEPRTEHHHHHDGAKKEKKKDKPKEAEPARNDKPADKPDPHHVEKTPQHREKVDPPPAMSAVEKDGFKWEQLGHAVANGKSDKDVVTIGRKEGLFRKLRFKVERSNVKMHDVIVHFYEGEAFSPKTRLEFAEGAWSNPIDLPGNKRAIKSVEFKYSDSTGSGNAIVEVWAAP